ncbi:MAG TPA: quinone-interacting membrane-bound oxidoreductase complex subunit QmoC [Candidatus Sulfomarinibacteraceae bacterium]|nr:quinone-interacting membrane-bound oxidoreductase complex subunit QmoC [Candidatus Sulfomarinibacteraceae bacterium]
MASIPIVQPSDLRREFFERGGENAKRCYQCATCSSVCELAPADAPFPRRQILLAQWGLFDQLMGDPAPWLCHQCNDCSVRCPREVNPGDIMASLRAMVVEKLAFPSVLGDLVGNVRKTWPLLVFGPILFWAVLLGITTGFGPVETHHGLQPGPTMGQYFYDAWVPHSLIYIVNFAAVGFVCLALFVSGTRFWKMTGNQQKRSGSFVGALFGAVGDIALHRKFSSCERGVPKRRWGHFMVMWGFVGAAVASGFAVVFLYADTPPFSWFFLLPFFEDIGYPVPITHWNKLLANISAVLLVIGGILLFVNRLRRGDKLVGQTTAFDRFFLWLVLSVIVTGVLTQVFRYTIAEPMVGFAVYVVHLGVVLSLFLTLPYSKFAHIFYRTLAMLHERMTSK